LNIAQADFFELVVPVPSREAQDVANKALAASSLEIELLQRKVELLRAQKRGLMKKVLTGQVRVTAAAETEPGDGPNR
jgi:type I restriction enzyme S subunit